ESSNTIDPISVIIYDVNGKVVEQKQKLTAGQTIQLGALYRPGVYILDVTQGTQRKQLKLVKIPD
ncbi:MAG TPA: T9SS type A sorting domain-containing protein, partial [Flavisolibacter sp.]|nr:T9SS type A sorting domain-containing protein [Flavisolibacter sp.]